MATSETDYDDFEEEVEEDFAEDEEDVFG